ncbi:histidine kinase dimerization/phospho-acceptor domain-containing protein [Flavobacterium sp. SUN046]|uniref:sensor histidine kinase n=1 Tax=Flavobacterium sp. SUN046 TaxID=3002440 RepID=UPI002DBBD0DD|nr:histidine kinase dimerization/phospho-acceptor domain-containing protein [Flavobacterium sp. SUN046]MEC4051064.1 histidine kinase dimerization/phospho-acceptor domain-containing protein [Flavobacterium sp. SUN046]
MKIKTKLNLGVGLLFFLIIILSLLSTFHIYSIKRDTQNILKANYETLEYSRNMLLALDLIHDNNSKSMRFFESNLNKQIANITETGEDKETFKLKEYYNQLQSQTVSDSLKYKIHQTIFRIMKLNMDAIKQKSDVAKRTSETATTWIVVIGTLCFLIAFNLLVNLPNNIANPIKELTASIKEIANKNYSERVNFLDHNEYGDLARSFNTMAEKLQEYHSSNLYKLSFEKKRLETLINKMHDPIIGLDSQEIIVFVNDTALKIIGLKKEQVLGQSATTLAVQNDLIRSLLKREEGNQQKIVPIKIFADGKESYFEKELVNITITPTGETQTISIGEVIILRNITVFKELDFAKTNFIATVSHELKTPISSIKLSLQLLEKEATGAINEEQKQLIESIKEDSQRLLKITGELLDISQLETGNIHLNIEKSDPYQIVNYAIEAVKVQAEQKQINIQVEAEANLPFVKADSEKTGWVLINFLTNAINYSSTQSQIIVKLHLEHDKVSFKVVDFGKGIDSRYKNKVFDKYFQIPGSNKSGTGLGLAISKEFIEAQNGTIEVESDLGLGSTFGILMLTYSI